ncbi:DUF3221 domain-containing protein [Pontibacter sp. Tf4]|uniref:DUF3221 domain-containing protein n=1 Tax=Pontibacter sp. Tf4 TaxID=2761620 RepID=UPI001629B4C3|nr:DUF3221 domain-containing protein [Pontibacter sp. Tf4]MBB6610972.1 DUF3221 domain-containing protein [Pontibacter sp. Tf4]
MTRSFATINLCLALLLLAGCRGKEPKRMPDTLPDIYGTITKISEGRENMPQLHVRAADTTASGYPEASITIDKNTLIEDKDGQHLKAANLQQGQLVEVWFGNEVLESMPVQTTAKAIRVDLQNPQRTK